MRKLRTVIIGLGKMGKIRYNAMQRHGGYQIVGLCDTDADSLAGYAEPAFTDWKTCIRHCMRCP